MQVAADDTDDTDDTGDTAVYDEVAAAVAEVGMIARGGFDVADLASAVGPPLPPLPPLADGRPCRAVVVIGNAGGDMWPHFARDRSEGPDPLDRWTREALRPIAERFGATFVHPSDEPFQPFQRWAQVADDVWPSPIGLLVHPTYGLWHAYRGAFLFAGAVTGLPPTGRAASPCPTCPDQPCLSTCPVDAFTGDGYDSAACAGHVRSGEEPTCLADGCAARRACPVGVEFRYDSDQMRFHMAAFAGLPS